MNETTSAFDPASFLDASTTEVLVKRPPLTSGASFQSTLTKLVSRTWQGKKDPTQGGIVIDVTHEFDLTGYPDEQKRLGLDKVSIVDGIMLDLTPAGSIDYAPGKNNKLRRYREALDLNTPGQAFSIRQMEGRTVLTKIKHEPYEGDIYDKIDAVAKG